MRSDRETPNVVLARGRDGEQHVRLSASIATLRRFRDGGLNAKLGEYCGLVHGNTRERTANGNVVDGGTQGLLLATALFRGLKRPLTSAGLDGEICAFISRPGCTFEFPNPSDVAVRCAAPLRSVFVTYARFEARDTVDGEILSWEWVLADARDSALPDGWDVRYEERIW